MSKRNAFNIFNRFGQQINVAKKIRMYVRDVDELFESLILFFQPREPTRERSPRCVENYWVSDRQGFTCFQFGLLRSNCVSFDLNGL